MWLRKTLLALVSVFPLFLLQGEAAYAHERWFVEKGQHAGEYFSIDWISSLVLSGTIFFIAAAITFDSSPWFYRLRGLFERRQRLIPRGIEWRTVAFLSGAMFIANSVMGVFLAPELALPNQRLATVGGIVQMVIGLFLISQLSFLLPGLLVIVVALPLATIYFGPAIMVDYFIEFASLALALSLFGAGANSLDRRLCKWMRLDPLYLAHIPLPVIRIGTGLTLAILAVHNKLMTPDLTLTFLDSHNLNFMAALGFTGFTNIHFVLAAGVMEFAVGLLLAFGIATRFIAAIVVMLLLITMVIFGPAELIGHLPLVGIAALLVYRGAGNYGVLFPQRSR